MENTISGLEFNFSEYKILIVDDVPSNVLLLKALLSIKQFQIVTANCGTACLEQVKAEVPDLILLDVMMPDMNGFSLYEVWNKQGSNVPVVFLSARDEDKDRLRGLGLGADDYITKPFNVLEVKARLKAIIRRNAGIAEAKKADEIRNGAFCFDLRNRRLLIMGSEVNLTQREYEILELLVTSPGKVYSRSDLVREIWGDGDAGDERSVDVYIRRIREKI